MMKKISLATMILALFAVAGCHDDSKKETECSVDNYELTCEDQQISFCYTKYQKERGWVRTDETYEVDGVTYTCDEKDNVVISNACKGDLVVDNDGNAVDALCGYYGTVQCKNGIASENKDDACIWETDETPDKSNSKCVDGQLVIGEGDAYLASSVGYFCDEEGFVYGCSGDKRVARNAYCDGDSVVKCVKNDSNGYNLVSDSCDAEQSCLEYDKGDTRDAACFDNSSISNDCGNTKVYGKCTGSGDALFMCTNDKNDGSGKLIRVDCAAKGRTCMLIEESDYGYDCALTCSDDSGNKYTDFGICSDNTLNYCNQSGKLESPLQCGSGKSCKWDTDHIAYDCI